MWLQGLVDRAGQPAEISSHSGFGLFGVDDESGAVWAVDQLLDLWHVSHAGRAGELTSEMVTHVTGGSSVFVALNNPEPTANLEPDVLSNPS